MTLRDDLETEKEHSAFLEELLKALVGKKWKTLTIYEANKIRENPCTRPHWEWRPLREEDKDERELLALIKYTLGPTFYSVIWWSQGNERWRNALEFYSEKEILEVAEIRRQE